MLTGKNFQSAGEKGGHSFDLRTCFSKKMYMFSKKDVRLFRHKKEGMPDLTDIPSFPMEIDFITYESPSSTVLPIRWYILEKRIPRG